MAKDLYTRLRDSLKDTLDFWEQDIEDADVADFSIRLKEAIEDVGSFKLYKYMPANLYTIRNIRRQVLHLSPNGGLNDLYEGLPRITGQNISYSQLKNISRLASISCFSENNNNPLMWSHYASKHQGICVEYDLSLLTDNPYNIISHLYPVIYSSRRTIGRDISELSENCTQIERDIIEGNVYDGDTLDNILPLFVLKGEEWDYEKEWRVIYTIKQQYDLNNDVLNKGNLPFPCISGVYLGFRIDQDFEEDVLDACLEIKRSSNREIPVYKEQIHPETTEICFCKEI